MPDTSDKSSVLARRSRRSYLWHTTRYLYLCQNWSYTNICRKKVQ